MRVLVYVYNWSHRIHGETWIVLYINVNIFFLAYSIVVVIVMEKYYAKI